MNRTKTVTIVSAILCVVLASSFVGAVFYYSSVLQQQSELVVELQDQAKDLKDANKNLTDTVLDLEAALNFR